MTTPDIPDNLLHCKAAPPYPDLSNDQGLALWNVDVWFWAVDCQSAVDKFRDLVEKWKVIQAAPPSVK